MASQRLRCWPTLKSTILEQGPLFQLSGILYTGTEIENMKSYADITDIIQSNNF